MYKENDKINEFKLYDENNNLISSNDINGIYVIYFYSKDNTSACTCQTLGYKDLYNKFNKLNVKIYGISKDSVNSHKKFKDKYELPFSLLSDSNKDIIRDFDLIKKKKMYGKDVEGTLRSSFIIKDGIILKANYNVVAKEDAANVLKQIEELV